jgi:hypothetical protein
VRPPSTSELLAAWERGLGQPSTPRALALLGAGWPETPAGELARLSIGRRDARLLELREHAFGAAVVAVATCPACAERLELSFDVAEVRTADPGLAVPLELRASGYELRFRLPDSGDLLAGGTATALLERCLLAAERDGLPAVAAELPAEVVELVEARMAEADPQADIRLALTCPACEHGWEAAFDVAAFLWSEVDAWARRTLWQVHLLARAYGWPEADVLALSPGRREFYLEAVAG